MDVFEKIREAEEKGLTTLDLRASQLKDLPKEILRLTTLRKLNLSRNFLMELPRGIIRLTTYVSFVQT